MLDGILAAKISNGQTIALDASPGPHTLHARIDWHRTDLIEFVLGEEPTTFDVFSKVRGPKPLLSIVFALIPGMWIGIRRAATTISHIRELDHRSNPDPLPTENEQSAAGQPLVFFIHFTLTPTSPVRSTRSAAPALEL
jgi:hypothetical protein